MTFSIQSLQSGGTEGALHDFLVVSSTPVLVDTVVQVLVRGAGANPADTDDFVQTAISVTIPAGMSSAPFAIGSVTDGLAEGNEGFTVELDGIDPALIAGGPASGVILAPGHLIDYRVGQGLNAGDLQRLAIDVASGSVTESRYNAGTGGLDDTVTTVSNVISPAGTGVPYAPGDGFNIMAEVGGGGAVFGALAQITTADGNDVVDLRPGDSVSALSATVATGAGDDLIAIQAPSGQSGFVEIDGGSGADTLNLRGYFTDVTLSGIETVRLGTPGTAPVPGDSFGFSTHALDGVERIIFSDPAQNVQEVVTVSLQTGGLHDFSGIHFQNSGEFLSGGQLISDELQVYGSDSDDSIAGATGVVHRISGGIGADHILGQGAADVLSGDDGDDLIWGAGTLSGGTGNDTLTVRGTGTQADGGLGSDDVYVSAAVLAQALALGVTGTAIRVARLDGTAVGDLDRVRFENAAADLIDLGTSLDATSGLMLHRFEYAPGGNATGIFVDLVFQPGEDDFAADFGITPPRCRTSADRRCCRCSTSRTLQPLCGSTLTAIRARRTHRPPPSW